MKRVININFQGRVIPIEESAYDVLKQYVESLRRHFANEEGRDEIINDIEGRVAELFGETLKKGATCITDDDVNKIIDSMGRPEDFDGEEASIKQQLGGEQQQQQQSSSSSSGNYSQQQQQQTGPNRMYRDENHKVLGGVCSGVANYFNMDRTLVRVLFVVFFGVAFIPYLVLWVAIPSSSTTVIGGQRKRLFRDSDEKVIAGVCSGLAQYFGVSVWVPRILFLLPFISFVFRWGHWGFWDFPHFLSVSVSPGSIIIYIILWLVLPEAKTTAEKLEMKGEKVDLNNIKNTIQNDMEGFGQRAKKWGEEMGEKAAEFGATVGQKGAEMGREAATAVKKNRTTFGDIIVFIFKAFAYFIIGSVLLSIVAGLFAAGVALTGLVPAWSFVIKDGYQTLFAWGTLIFFVWLTVVAVVTFIIRRITKRKGNSNIIRYTFVCLWLVGLFCAIGLVSSIASDFRSKSNLSSEVVALSNPKVDKLDIKISEEDYDDEENWLKLTPFASFVGDTVFVQNIKIKITKSPNDSFWVRTNSYSRGVERSEANELASKIQYTITQSDTVLNLPKGIAITRKDKFRNQHVIVNIAVPVGKKFIIKTRNNYGQHVKVDFGNDNYDWNWYEWNDGGKTRSLSSNVEYVITEKGIERTSKKKSNKDDGDDDDDNNAIEKYKKSKEDLQKEYENAEKEANEKKKKADELKKELDKPVVDSTRYKYVPEKPKKAVPKTTAQADMNISTSSLMMMRFSL